MITQRVTIHVRKGRYVKMNKKTFEYITSIHGFKTCSRKFWIFEANSPKLFITDIGRTVIVTIKN